jgi:membrane protein required for colicin V production
VIPLTAFDYAVVAVVVVSVLFSLVRGAVREVMSLVSWIGAFLIALHLAPILSRLLPESFGHPWLRLFAAFIGVMLVCLVVFMLFTLALAEFVRGAGLKPWDRLLGAVFGLARAVVILVVLVLAAGLTPLPREPAWRNALSSPPLEALAKTVRAFLPQAVAARIQFE